MPDLLNIFEFAAKTVRHISREFRVAWVSGVEAARRDALVEFEEENEFLEPQSADFNDTLPQCPLFTEAFGDDEWGAGWRRGWESATEAYSVGRYRKAPAASTTAVEDPSGAGTPLLASEADSIHAIKGVLSQHEPRSRAGYVACLGRNQPCAEFADWQDWRDHVAPIIADRIAKARTQAAEK